MNTLICGKQSGFCRQLADRLSREKNEIYYYSGNISDEKLCKNVFQEYHFPYLHENITQIFNSAQPETVIVTGAYDDNFTWANPEQDSTKFVTSMTSLFMAAQSQGAKRLIFVSSVDVYESNTEEIIASDTVPNAKSVRATAFLKAERLLREFNSESENANENKAQMEIIILRLPTVFGDCHGSSLHDVCLRSALNYINNGVIPIIPELKHSGMYFCDAAEAVIRCLKLKKSETNRTFQLKGLTFTEKELADTLIDTKWRKDAIIETQASYEGLSSNTGYPPERIDNTDAQALGFSLKYDLKTALDLLCRACLKIDDSVTKRRNRRLRILPFIEAVVLAIFTYFASSWLLGTWVGEAINLFIIYVLLFAISYGLSYGLFSSILAGIGVLLISVQTDSFIDVISNYVFYLKFWQLILVGIMAGYIRDKFKRKNKQLTEENVYLSTELADVTLINDNNAYVKNVFEKRLIGYTNSLSHIYELTSQLEFYEPQKVVFQAVRIVSELMEMGDVAVYTASSGFLRLAAATSDLATSCGKTIRIDENTFFNENIENQSIYVNKECIKGRPTFGGGVYSDGQLIAMIFSWTTDLRQINLYSSNMLAISCRLIEKSMSRALLFEESLRNDIYEKDSRIMSTASFLKLLGIFEDGYKQGLFYYTILKLDKKSHTNDEVSRGVRATDTVGIYKDDLYALLSYATPEEAQIVINRYRGKDMDATIVSVDTILDTAEPVVEEVIEEVVPEEPVAIEEPVVEEVTEEPDIDYCVIDY